MASASGTTPRSVLKGFRLSHSAVDFMRTNVFATVWGEVGGVGCSPVRSDHMMKRDQI
jgi:hypothetical protein